MPDLLVKLYDLPPLAPLLERQAQTGVTIRRALAPELRLIASWVEQHFGPAWRGECEVAFARQPIACHIAVERGALVGFACCDATFRGFFGPTGVLERRRGRGIGAALLVASLHALAEQGHAYAIIGGVGPADFYAATVGALPIPGSDLGPYAGMLEVSHAAD